MAKHDDFYPLILAEIPACPLMMVKNAITRAAMDFCRSSIVWRETLDPIAIKQGVDLYDLDLPTDSMLVVVMSAKMGGITLTTVSKPSSVRWPDEGQPYAYSMPSHQAIQVHPMPYRDEDDPLVLEVALMPTLTAGTLPDILADRYFEAIGEGAKSILKRMPNQPWTDVQGAMFAQQIFSVRTSEARIEREFGNVRGSMQVTPRAFGA